MQSAGTDTTILVSKSTSLYVQSLCRPGQPSADLKGLDDVVTQKVPSAQRSAAAGSEVSYRLPKDEASRCDLRRPSSTHGLHTGGILESVYNTASPVLFPDSARRCVWSLHA